MDRPSIDPELMIRMLFVGYVFAIRSERLICREVKVNLAYRWFCKLGIEDAIPDHSAFSRARNERFREGRCFSPRVRECRRSMPRSWPGWGRRFCHRCEPDPGRRQ
jgi:transposase